MMRSNGLHRLRRRIYQQTRKSGRDSIAYTLLTRCGVDTEEAKALYEDIRGNHSNMIPAVGINIHEAGTPEIDRFSSDFDSYEYKDTVDNWELQVQNIADDIRMRSGWGKTLF